MSCYVRLPVLFCILLQQFPSEEDQNVWLEEQQVNKDKTPVRAPHTHAVASLKGVRILAPCGQTHSRLWTTFLSSFFVVFFKQSYASENLQPVISSSYLSISPLTGRLSQPALTCLRYQLYKILLPPPTQSICHPNACSLNVNKFKWAWRCTGMVRAGLWCEALSAVTIRGD